ncbi:Retrovirus-related Pol polyprotein LINE-1 [Senna tora]|uniref:Retrovirus-related Pol polyprotein LINE-1 n=1 Tax=Senna tora TaxID=362788 RepID=A0A834SMZ1_9FABA|nr:Retrovirus-related Pol polyprotein LINE-1 [Senna tora]
MLVSAQNFSDQDLLALAINFKYLEAEFYLIGSTGRGLDSYAPGLAQGGPPPIGGRLALLDSLTTRDIIFQFGLQDIGQMRAIRSRLSEAEFPSRPLLNISNNLFAQIMNDAFGRTLRPPFNPYANTINFLIASYVIPYVGVTGLNSAMSVSASEDEVEDDEGEEDFSDSDASSEGDDDGSPFVPCPKLKFTQEELDEWCRPWKLTLIVHLMGRTGFFAVSFTNQNDFVYAYQEGPWMVADHYLVVQRWRPNFNPKDANEVTKIAAWVRVPGLPLEFYNARCLWRIGDLVGKTLKIDPTTSLTSRGKFARICVEINLKKQLVPQVEVKGRCYAVEYEGLHMVCFHCGRYGHTRDFCILRKETEGKEPSQQVDLNVVPNDGEQGREHGGGAAPVTVQVDARQEDNNGNDGIFGPWMVVSRAKRVENSVGSGINEFVVQGWTKDPNESNFSRKINGKDIIEDRAPWKPNLVQNHPPVLTLAQPAASNPRKSHFSNPVFDSRPRSSSGPNGNTNGPIRNMVTNTTLVDNIGPNGYLGSQGLMIQDGNEGNPFQPHEKSVSSLLRSQPREPLDRGPRQRALRGREEEKAANGGTTNHGGGHGVGASASGCGNEASASRMDVEQSVGSG